MFQGVGLVASANVELAYLGLRDEAVALELREHVVQGDLPFTAGDLSIRRRHELLSGQSGSDYT